MGVEAPIKHPRTPDAEQCVKMRQAIDRPTKPSWSDFTRATDLDQPLTGTFPYYSDGVPGEKYGAGNYKATNGRLYKVSTSGEGTPLAWYPAPGYRDWPSGALVNVSNRGISRSSTTSGIHSMILSFGTQDLYPDGADIRVIGFQLRCLLQKKRRR